MYIRWVRTPDGTLEARWKTPFSKLNTESVRELLSTKSKIPPPRGFEMEILIRHQAQPVEVVLSLSIWEAEILGALLGKLNPQSIRDVLEIEGRNPLPEQVYGITSEIYWALVKDSRVAVGDPNS